MKPLEREALLNQMGRNAIRFLHTFTDSKFWPKAYTVKSSHSSLENDLPSLVNPPPSTFTHFPRKETAAYNNEVLHMKRW